MAHNNPNPAGLGGIVGAMLEAVYLVILIGAFVVIGAMSMFILFKLFAGQD